MPSRAASTTRPNQVKDSLSKEIDTDYASAISSLTSRQAALEASLRLTAQIYHK